MGGEGNGSGAKLQTRMAVPGASVNSVAEKPRFKSKKSTVGVIVIRIFVTKEENYV